MDLEQLEKALEEATENLSKLGRQMKTAARREAELRSEYENLKNSYLIELYAEEVDKASKRTVDLRTAMYRLRYKNERMAWLLAKADFESDRDLFKGLQSKITAIQSLIGLEREKMRLV
jgi:predicted  nucleic acid-binding Zn-ribbon protein